MLRLVCFRHDDILSICLVTAIGLGCWACAAEMIFVVHEAKWLSDLAHEKPSGLDYGVDLKVSDQWRLVPSAFADSRTPNNLNRIEPELAQRRRRRRWCSRDLVSILTLA